MLFTPEKDERRFMNSRQKRILDLQPNDEFLFSYTLRQRWTEDRYRVLHNGVVELISEHPHWCSRPSPGGPRLVDADRPDRFSSLEKIAKDATTSFMVFKEL